MTNDMTFERREELIREEDHEEGIITKSFRHKTLEERAAEYGGDLMLDGEYDWVNQ